MHLDWILPQRVLCHDEVKLARRQVGSHGAGDEHATLRRDGSPQIRMLGTKIVVNREETPDLFPSRAK